MLTNDDIFLLFASSIEFQSGKLLIKKLYGLFDNFSEILNCDLDKLKSKLSSLEKERFQILRESVKNIKLEEIKRTLDRKNIKFLAFSNKEYPEKLKSIHDPPLGLFYKGNLSVLKSPKSVAIVGTRSATNYGLSISKKIASLLSEQKLTVVSGLASGIDASAHIGAIKNGKTIAVLGTGTDIVFPISNEDLFKEILDKENLIVSEYPPGTLGLPWNFPQRNRIISALSDAVVVIEGDLQSGALITARFAIKQNKPLFALPGPIDSLASNGPNILIKSGVAELLTSVQDILEKIGEGKQIQISFKNDKSELDKLSEKQKVIYKLLSSRDIKSFDALIQETNLNVQELTQHLSILELKGIVEKTNEGGYVRV